MINIVILKSCMKILIIILFSHLICRAGEYSIYKIYSQNEQYYIKMIPYGSHYQDIIGKTEVYNSKSGNKIYEIEKYFEFRKQSYDLLFISGDGKVICRINPYCDYPNGEKASVVFYKNGEYFKSYTKYELTGCDSDNKDGFLLYDDYYPINLFSNNYDKRKQIKRKAFEKDGRTFYKYLDSIDYLDEFSNTYKSFSNNDTIFIITPEKFLLHLDMKNCTFLGRTDLQNEIKNLEKKVRLNKFEEITFNAPDRDIFPALIGGKKIQDVLADSLSLKLMTGYKSEDIHDDIYYFAIFLSGIIDNKGKISIDKLNCGNILEKNKVKEIIKKMVFNSDSIPELTGKWYFSDYFDYKNKNDSLARLEYIQNELITKTEYERRTLLDSINGIYIPKNVYDCCKQLDLLLTTKDKNKIDSLKSDNEMIKFHLGLGMWIRNNWGLWTGSRLSKYMNEFGISIPDDMSAIILELYYKYRKNTDISIEEIEEYLR